MNAMKAMFSNNMTILQHWVYWVFSFWASLIANNLRILSILLIFIPFRYLFSTLMFFLHYMIKILRQIKKILVELINRLLYNTSVGVMENVTGNIKSIFLFLESFFGENCVLKVDSAEIFLVKLLLEWLQLVQKFEKRLMVLLHWQHNISMYTFYDETYFANGV